MVRAICFLLAGLTATILLSFAGCRSSAPPPVRSLVLSGSRTLAPLMDDIGQRFEEQHLNVRINVETTASERGAADTRNGLADIGMLGRPLRPDEAGLFATPIALDGVAIIVHRDNSVRQLDDRQIVGLFTRTYTNWKQVGGSDRPVTLVSVGNGRALREVFSDYFSLPSQLKIDHPLASSEQAIAAVAGRPEAIGYACMGRAEAAAKQLPIRLLPLNGVPATLAEVRARRYPFTRPLLLLTRDRPSGLVGEFLDFARSEAVRDLLDKHGFAPLQLTDTRP